MSCWGCERPARGGSVFERDRVGMGRLREEGGGSWPLCGKRLCCLV